MNWKLLLTLFIIIGITGLLLFSEKGRDFKEKYLGKYTKIVGGYLTGLTGKFKATSSVNRTLPISIEASYSSLKGQEFSLSGDPLKVELKYDTVSIGGQNVKLKDKDTLGFETGSMIGTVVFDEEGKVTISGNADSVELNGMVFSPPTGGTKISFNLIGIPSNLILSNSEKDKMVLSGVTGLLKLSNWSPLALQGDNLDISYFKGTVKQEGDSVNIAGTVEKISLNGVDLSLKK